LRDNRTVQTPKRLLNCVVGLILVIVAGNHPVSAQGSADDISARLVGQPLYLRGCWGQDKLKFDADGQPQKRYKIVSFTESGIDVDSVKLSGDELRITGQRVGLKFVDGVPQRIEIKGKGYSRDMTIEVRRISGGDFGKAIDAIFAPNLDSLAPTVPSYWQPYFAKHLSIVSGATTAGSTERRETPPAGKDEAKPFHIAGAMTRPVVLRSVDPEFSETARLSKVSGNVEIYLWVMQDGSTSHLTIVKPMGLGLDEKAIEAVSKYQFKPATKDGVPVKVDLYIDVNFQIF
jgi:TonB family protein